MNYLTPEQTAEHLMRRREHIEELIALGIVPCVYPPWNGPLVPVAALPPFVRVSEED